MKRTGGMTQELRHEPEEAPPVYIGNLQDCAMSQKPTAVTRLAEMPICCLLLNVCSRIKGGMPA